MVSSLSWILGVLGLELTGFANKIWHLCIMQGLLFGVGASFLYIAAMGVPAQWFVRRRGLALGLGGSGSGIGGLVLPFIASALNNAIGIFWSYRILGFIILGLNIVTCVLVKEKCPRHKRKIESNENGKKRVHPRPKLSEIFNFNVLKDTNYLLWVVGSMIAVMGYFVPFFFLPSYCSYLGMSSETGTVMVAVMSTGNFASRIVAGLIGDRIGHLNTNIIFTLLAGVSSLAIWTHAYTYGTLMAFSVVFGLLCCPYVTFLSTVTVVILGMERFPTGLSIIILSNCISVWGPTIASGAESRVNAEPYYTYKIFTGAACLVGGALLVILKIKMSKGVFAKV